MTKASKRQRNSAQMPVRTAKSRFERIEASLAKRWYLIAGACVLLGWGLTSGGAALHTLRQLNAALRGDAKLTGTWSNVPVEGVANSADYPPPASSSSILWLSIAAKDGQISGQIYSPVLCKSLPWNYVQFSGTNGWFSATAEAFDFIQGRTTVFAHFHLHLKGDELVLTKVGNDVLGFPQTATLYPMPDSDRFNDVPSICRGWLEKFKKEWLLRHPAPAHSQKITK